MTSPPPGSAPSGTSVRVAAATLLGIHGALVVLHSVFGPPSLGGAVTGEVTLAVLHFLVVLAVAGSLSRGRPWAWWVALGLTLLGLFFLVPLAMGVLLGGGTELARNAWELALVLGSPAALVIVFALLTTHRGAWLLPRPGPPPSGEDGH